jgi:hypothetical protein
MLIHVWRPEKFVTSLQQTPFLRHFGCHEDKRHLSLVRSMELSHSRRLMRVVTINPSGFSTDSRLRDLWWFWLGKSNDLCLYCREGKEISCLDFA